MSGLMAHLTVGPLNELPAIKQSLIVFAIITGGGGGSNGARHPVTRHGKAHKLMNAASELFQLQLNWTRQCGFA